MALRVEGADAFPARVLKLRVPMRSAVVALVLGLALATGQSLYPAAARNVSETPDVFLDLADMAYHRQGDAVVADILAGDIPSAEQQMRVLETLEAPQPWVVAKVRNAIGIAYGESGRFETAVAHLQESLRLADETLPTLQHESRAYLVYVLAALGRFDEAERLRRSPGSNWPWLFAKLAALYADLGHYECAVANGETALASGRAGYVLVPFHVNMSDVADRDAVLRDWADRLDAARRSMDEATVATESEDGNRASVACVGGRSSAAQPDAAEHAD